MSRVARRRGTKTRRIIHPVKPVKPLSKFLLKIFGRMPNCSVDKSTRIPCWKSSERKPEKLRDKQCLNKSSRLDRREQHVNLNKLKLVNAENAAALNSVCWKNKLCRLSHPLLRMSVINHVFLGLEVVVSTMLFNKFFYS